MSTQWDTYTPPPAKKPFAVTPLGCSFGCLGSIIGLVLGMGLGAAVMLDPATREEAGKPAPTVTATTTVTKTASVAPQRLVAPRETSSASPRAPRQAPAPAPEPKRASGPFANCSEARAAGAAPLYRGDPGYRPKLDRDDDGVACE